MSEPSSPALDYSLPPSPPSAFLIKGRERRSACLEVLLGQGSDGDGIIMEGKQHPDLDFSKEEIRVLTAHKLDL